MPRPIPPFARRSAVLLVAVLATWAGPAHAQVLRSSLWVTNGPVNAEVVSGNTLYLGGEFDRVGPAVGGWAPVDSAGRWTPPAPLVSGKVDCAAPDGSGGWFVGGSFDAVGTQPRGNLAHFDSSGQLTAWSAATNGPVYALLLFAGRLYAGGAFTTVDGQARNHLAVVDTLSGGLGAWNPNADGDVHALTPFGSTFLVGGQFGHLGGFVRANLAGVDTTGTVWSWDPEANGSVYAISVIHRLVPNVVTVYAGGDFTFIGGQARTYLAALDATGGSATFGQATAFNASANNTVRALVVAGTLTPTIYVGGDFGNIGGQPRSSLAALNGSGVATSWNPGVGGLGGQRSVVSVDALALRGTTLHAGGAFLSLGGQARSGAGAVDTGTGAVLAWNPSPNGPVDALALGAQAVYVGGAFSSLGGVARNNLAALDLVSGEATAWNPNADAPVLALQNVGGRIYAGGAFAHVGGAAHAYIAQLDATTGAAGGWAPSPNASVTCIGGRALAGAKFLVYFGGDFTSASGLPRRHLAAMSDDPLAPGLDAWNPAADTTVSALAVSGSTIFVGGKFQHVGVGGTARAFVAALDVTGAATAWNPGPDAPVAALATTGTPLYVGGSFANVGGHLHRGVAAIDPASGSVQSWPAQVFGPVSAIAATSGAVYVGGVFTNVGGSSRTNLAALDAATGAPTAWDPEPWTPLIPFTLLVQPEVRALAGQSGSVYAGGVFATLLDSPHSGIAGIFEATTGVDPAPPSSALPPAEAVEALPNPFRGGVALGVRMPRAGELELRVYDAAGRLVRDLGTTPAAAGEQRIDWDGRDGAGRAVPDGVYLVRARSGDWRANGRVVRLR